MTDQKTLDKSSIKIKAKKAIEIEDGKHEGKITRVDFRETEKGTQTFQYLDIGIDLIVDGEVITLHHGVPFNLSEISRLGKLLKQAKFDFVEGEEYSIEQIEMHLDGRKVTFQTTTDETEQGNFARIIPETLKFK